MNQLDTTQERLIETYRKKAKHYDIVSRLYPVPGYPQRAQRRRAVQALRLRPGSTVVDLACGTGQNFPLIEQAIGPDGRIIGVDLTDAMLAQAQRRIEHNGWSNISLVQADAADYIFPAEVNAILSTYALSHVPECGDVIAHGAEGLARGGRWVVLDLKAPANAPRLLAQLGTALGRRFGSIDEWLARRPWEGIRAAMQDALGNLFWNELCFGTAFLAAASSAPGGPDDSGHYPFSATKAILRTRPARSQSLHSRCALSNSSSASSPICAAMSTASAANASVSDSAVLACD
jgi:ubiquinone/menaquinone biosynthesis C-methylase UbiE